MNMEQWSGKAANQNESIVGADATIDIANIQKLRAEFPSIREKEVVGSYHAARAFLKAKREEDLTPGKVLERARITLTSMLEDREAMVKEGRERNG